MKILKVTATNFGSYDHFEMNFDNLGLALVYGATGSGKSTLMDMVSWGLYGVTSKNGTADDVKSWTSQSVTSVTIQLEGTYVTRRRGTSIQNDLLWGSGPGEIIRGKDLKDTQRILSEKLGADVEVFLTTSYFSEFNASANFFMAKAKERREVFEKIAPLKYPNQLQEKIANAKKQTRKVVSETEATYQNTCGQLNILRQQLASLRRQDIEFEKERLRQVQALTRKAHTFDQDKRGRCEALHTKIKEAESQLRPVKVIQDRIQEIRETVKYLEESHCDECGQPTAGEAIRQWEQEISVQNRHLLVQSQVAQTLKSLKSQLENEESTFNAYGDMVEAQKAQSNPYASQTLQVASQLTDTESKGVSLKETLEGLERRIGALDQLSGITVQLRGLLLEESVKECEYNVNTLLSKTFDSEFQVSFTVEDDNLEVGVTKNGYEASFTQLSKGQRRLLSLCFSVSVMEMAANTAGVHMDLLMLDEPCDGMDEAMKAKAYDLYQDLATRHGSILVIEHSSTTQALFDKRYRVVLEEDHSRVYEE